MFARNKRTHVETPVVSFVQAKNFVKDIIYAQYSLARVADMYESNRLNRQKLIIA